MLIDNSDVRMLLRDTEGLGEIWFHASIHMIHVHVGWTFLLLFFFFLRSKYLTFVKKFGVSLWYILKEKQSVIHEERYRCLFEQFLEMFGLEVM